MARDTDNGLASTLEAFERARKAAREAVMPALIKSANEIADGQRAMVPVDSGELKESITVTPPGQSTPPYSQPGGSRVASEAEVIVTAGNEAVRYPHLVEFGTAHSEAHPYFWPVYWLLQKRIQARTNRTVKKAIREAWTSK